MFSSKMLRYLLAAALSLAPLPIVDAQSAGWLPLAVGGAAAYQGPGDITSFVAWWGFRCYSNAYAGNVADITDSSTGNTTGTRLQCSGGTVSALVSSSACTFVGSTNCSPLATTCAVACEVAVIYDQSGNTNCTTACDASATHAAGRPTLISSCQNSRPCMSSSGTIQLTSPIKTISASQPVSTSAVSNSAAQATAGAYVLFENNVQIYYFGGQYNAFAGSSFAITAAAGSWHATQFVYNGASSIAYVDSAQTTGGNVGAGGIAAASSFHLGTNNASTSAVSWAEGGYASGAFSTPTQSALDLNQRSASNGWNF